MASPRNLLADFEAEGGHSAHSAPAHAATVFHSRMRGLIAFAAFSGASGLIYLLIKSEDYALLIGSVTAFGAIALIMVITRNLDWYGARTRK